MNHWAWIHQGADLEKLTNWVYSRNHPSSSRIKTERTKLKGGGCDEVQRREVCITLFRSGWIDQETPNNLFKSPSTNTDRLWHPIFVSSLMQSTAVALSVFESLQGAYVCGVRSQAQSDTGLLRGIQVCCLCSQHRMKWKCIFRCNVLRLCVHAVTITLLLRCLICVWYSCVVPAANELLYAVGFWNVFQKTNSSTPT